MGKTKILSTVATLGVVSSTLSGVSVQSNAVKLKTTKLNKVLLSSTTDSNNTNYEEFSGYGCVAGHGDTPLYNKDKSIRAYSNTGQMLKVLGDINSTMIKVQDLETGSVGYIPKTSIQLIYNSNSSTESISSISGSVIDVTSRLNVRSNSTMGSNIICKIPNRTSLLIIGKSGNWFKVKYNNVIGYVYGFYIYHSGVIIGSSDNNSDTTNTNAGNSNVNNSKVLSVSSSDSSNIVNTISNSGTYNKSKSDNTRVSGLNINKINSSNKVNGTGIINNTINNKIPNNTVNSNITNDKNNSVSNIRNDVPSDNKNSNIKYSNTNNTLNNNVTPNKINHLVEPKTDTLTVNINGSSYKYNKVLTGKQGDNTDYKLEIPTGYKISTIKCNGKSITLQELIEDTMKFNGDMNINISLIKDSSIHNINNDNIPNKKKHNSVHQTPKPTPEPNKVKPLPKPNNVKPTPKPNKVIPKPDNIKPTPKPDNIKPAPEPNKVVKNSTITIKYVGVDGSDYTATYRYSGRTGSSSGEIIEPPYGYSIVSVNVNNINVSLKQANTDISKYNTDVVVVSVKKNKVIPEPNKVKPVPKPNKVTPKPDNIKPTPKPKPPVNPNPTPPVNPKPKPHVQHKPQVVNGSITVKIFNTSGDLLSKKTYTGSPNTTDTSYSIGSYLTDNKCHVVQAQVWGSPEDTPATFTGTIAEDIGTGSRYPNAIHTFTNCCDYSISYTVADNQAPPVSNSISPYLAYSKGNSTLNVLSSPGGSTSQIIHFDCPLKVIGEDGNYYKVQVNGSTGYLEKSEVSTNVVPENNVIQYYNSNMLLDSEDRSTEFCTSTAIKNKASEIVQGSTSRYEMAQRLYVWIAQNITYNYTILKHPVSQWTNVINPVDVFNNRTGICTGYAQLYAAMCGSVGIQCKVVGGTTNGGEGNSWGQHAWNRVYISGKGWFGVDCTFASTAYTPTSDQGAGKSKSDLQWILNPSTVTKVTDGNTVTSWGNLDYFDNPSRFNQAHRQQYVSSQEFLVVPQSKTVR